MLLRRYRGLLAEVARNCEVGTDAVSRVFHGQSKSARITEEILAEIERRQSEEAA